jgi:hypothetical protein
MAGLAPLVVGRSGMGGNSKKVLERIQERVKKATQVDILGPGHLASETMMNSIPAIRNQVFKAFIDESSKFALNDRDRTNIRTELTELFTNSLGLRNNNFLFMEAGAAGVAVSPVGTMAMLSLSWPENVHRWMMPSSVREAPVVQVKHIKIMLRRGDGTEIELPATPNTVNSIQNRPLLGPASWTNWTDAGATAWVESNTRNETDNDRKHPTDASAFNLLGSAWNAVTIGEGDGVDIGGGIVAVKYKVRTGVATYEERTRAATIPLDKGDHGSHQIEWVNPHDNSAGSDYVTIILNRENGSLRVTTGLGIKTADDAVGITKVLPRFFKTTEFVNTVETIRAGVIDDRFDIPQGAVVQAPLTDDFAMDLNAMTGIDAATLLVDNITAMFGQTQNNESWQFIRKCYEDFQELVGNTVVEEMFYREWNAEPPPAGNMDVERHRKLWTIPFSYLAINLAKFTQYRKSELVVVCGLNTSNIVGDITEWETVPGGDGGVNDFMSDAALMTGLAKIGRLNISARVVTSRNFPENEMYIYLVPQGEENVRGIEHFSYDYRMSRNFRSPVFPNVPVITATRRDTRKAFNPAMAKLVIRNNNGNYPSMNHTG